MNPRFVAKPMFGRKSQLPAVDCTWGIQQVQVTTGKAKLIARWLFGAGATAYLDAALYRLGRHHEEREEMIRLLASLHGPGPEGYEPGAPLPDDRLPLTEDGRENVWVTSIFAPEPLVDFQFGRMQGQLSPEEAEETADLLYTTAVQAETDGGLWLALKRLGLPEENAARILQEMRSERFNLRAKVKQYERG